MQIASRLLSLRPSDRFARNAQSCGLQAVGLPEIRTENAKVLNLSQAWRSRIGGCWKWSEALPDLLQLWRDRGVGLIATHSTLHWSGSALVGLSPSPPRDGRAPAWCSCPPDTRCVPWQLVEGGANAGYKLRVGQPCWEDYREQACSHMTGELNGTVLVMEEDDIEGASTCLWEGLCQVCLDVL